MADSKIKLTVEGLDSEDGHVLLSDLVEYLRLQNQALTSFDKLVGGGRAVSKFRVVNLSHRSPATAVVEVRPQESDNDLSGILVERYFGTLQSINAGEVPEDLDATILKNLRALAEPVGRRVKRAALSRGRRVVRLSETFAATVDQALSRTEVSVGSIEGTVERFNAHRGANVFYIYPVVGPNKIACRFPSHLLDRAASAVMRKVRVSGDLVYLRTSNFPHEINVREIEVYEPEESLPRFEDLRGVAPDATGDQASEDFVRSGRDAWED